MFKKYFLYKFLVLMLALTFAFLYGCAKPPTKEIENAEKVIAEAKQKEVDLYVQDIFIKAEDSLKKAKDLIAVKKYKEAKKAADDAASFALQAIPMVETNKEKMKTEVEQMIPEVQGALDELKSLVAKAIKKKAQINREEIQSSVGKWEIDMVNIKDELQEGRVRPAHDQLMSMKDQIKSQRESLKASLEPKTTAAK
jgi:uncharacterized protein (UPF0332 family)